MQEKQNSLVKVIKNYIFADLSLFSEERWLV
jgi:hypothetical protein